jgi:8-oxo-dGTP pyrophosphatase MutT (NUDIX family)
MSEPPDQTWDVHPISSTPPYGAMIVVYRGSGARRVFLLLHRKHQGPDYEGPWAWGPPSGARYPEEDIDRCAERELLEETGLEGKPRPLQGSGEDWPTYVLEAAHDTQPRLSEEHDRWCWVTAEKAISRIEPQVVRDAFRNAVRVLQRHE